MTLQLATNEKFIREEATQDLKSWKSQSELIQARRSEELVALLRAAGKRIKFLADEMMELDAGEIFKIIFR